MRYERYDQTGKLVEVLDLRTVSECMTERITAIKQRCFEEIEKTGVSWMVEREITGGKAVPQEIKDLCQQHRQKCDLLEKRIREIADDAGSNEDKDACDQIQRIDWNLR